jgi:TonB family protein
MIIGLVLGLLLPLSANTDCSESRVVRAVSPFYSATPAANGMHGEVVIEVEIAPEGRVHAARAVRGNKLLAADALRASRQWEFEPCEDKPLLRKISLNFRFVLLTADSPQANITPIFFPPYTTEVRTIRPMLKHTRAISKK